MRLAGRLAADVLDMIGPQIRAGMSTSEIDRICHDFIVDVQKAIPAPLNYKGFPKSICTSVNHVVCHGIPGDRVLKAGDILNVDVTVIKDGFHGDTSRMYYVGAPSVMAKRLVEITHEAMWRAIKVVRPGATLRDIGRAIQGFVEAQRFSVVEDYCGHGIGQVYHEDPQVIHYDDRRSTRQDVALVPGMTFTIEPMINEGTSKTRTKPDGCTVVTADSKLSAQWEAARGCGGRALGIHLRVKKGWKGRLLTRYSSKFTFADWWQ